MSTADATVVEAPPKTGESAIEKPRGEVKSKIESGDVSGVYRVAQHEVDEEIAKGQALSKIDDPNAAAVAGPEIVALKQAGSDFENKAQKALGGLKSTLDTVSKTVSAAEAKAEASAPVPAVAEYPAIGSPESVLAQQKALELQKNDKYDKKYLLDNFTGEIAASGYLMGKDGKETNVLPTMLLKQDAEDRVYSEAKKESATVEVPLANAPPPAETKVKAPAPVVETKVEAPKVISVEETGDTTNTVESLSAEEEKSVVEADDKLQKLDAELIAEKTALEEFNSTHGKAHTPLEQAYLDALGGRIAALEFEKTAHETSDASYETMAKQAELKQKADKAEAAYQAMYEGYRNQPVEPHPDKVADDAHLEGDEHPSVTNTFQGGGESISKTGPQYETSVAAPPQKPKGAFGKFVDGLKFWRYISGSQK